MADPEASVKQARMGCRKKVPASTGVGSGEGSPSSEKLLIFKIRNGSFYAR